MLDRMKSLRAASLAAALFLTLPCWCQTAAAPWQLGPFARPDNAQPIITRQPEASFVDPILGKPVLWEALHTFNPAAIVRQGKVVVLYRAEDNSGELAIGMHTSRLGMAESADGIHFTQRPEPVFYPADDAQKTREWPGGVEDPRLVEAEDGTYVLTYTQWNRTTYSVGIATSRDLVHWTKHGPAFGDTGRYGTLKYKSAGILTQLKGGRLVAAKLKGTYWMYWGEGRVSLATSPDLIHWTPVEDPAGHPVALLEPRPGRFDSGLPEVGPPPILTEAGIVLLYNGKNAVDADHDPALDRAAYSAGQALFSAADPAHLLERSDRPFLQPSLPWERSGQYAAGTTFIEGLVRFHDRWLLYYGSADSLVGVALTTPKARLSFPKGICFCFVVHSFVIPEGNLLLLCRSLVCHSRRESASAVLKAWSNTPTHKRPRCWNRKRTCHNTTLSRQKTTPNHKITISKHNLFAPESHSLPRPPNNAPRLTIHS